MEIFQFIKSTFYPENVLIYILALALILSDFPKFPLARFAKPLFAIIALFFLMMTIFPLGEMALRPLEDAAPRLLLPEKIAGIVMLTGDEDARLSEDRQMPIAAYAALREIEFARLARRYPEARLVVSGGTPLALANTTPAFTVPHIDEANLAAMGIVRSRLTFEDKSHNTYENAVESKALIQPKEGEIWLLVTSAFHMPRALLCFEKQGWQMKSAPSDYLTASVSTESPPYSFSHQMRLLTIALHEYLGLVSYKIVGWIDRLWL